MWQLSSISSAKRGWLSRAQSEMVLQSANDSSWTQCITCYLCWAGQLDFTWNVKNPFALNRSTMAVCVINRKAARNQLVPGASFLLSLLLQTEKSGNCIMEWVHPSQFILLHWKASLHAYCCQTSSRIPGFKSRVVGCSLRGSFNTLKTK